MTRIAIDAMGGDHAPFEIVAGAVWAAAEYGVALELVGKQDRIEHCLEVIQQEGFLSDCGKAGRKRHMGWRPTVRGVVMNPCDHPHGGGEGKSPVGMPSPVTPWGKPTLGYKTRNKKKQSNKFIVKRRNAK